MKVFIKRTFLFQIVAWTCVVEHNLVSGMTKFQNTAIKWAVGATVIQFSMNVTSQRSRNKIQQLPASTETIQRNERNKHTHVLHVITCAKLNTYCTLGVH